MDLYFSVPTKDATTLGDDKPDPDLECYGTMSTKQTFSFTFNVAAKSSAYVYLVPKKSKNRQTMYKICKLFDIEDASNSREINLGHATSSQNYLTIYWRFTVYSEISGWLLSDGVIISGLIGLMSLGYSTIIVFCFCFCFNICL